MTLKNTKNNAECLTALLLKKLNVKVHKATIVHTLQNHPDYPSLLSISDSLSEWKVANEGYLINKKEFNVAEMKCPFLAHLNEDGGRFILVNHIDSQSVNYEDERVQNKNLSLSDFLSRWDGIVLHAIATAESGEEKYIHTTIKQTLQKLSLPLLLSLFIVLIGYFLNLQKV